MRNNNLNGFGRLLKEYNIKPVNIIISCDLGQSTVYEATKLDGHPPLKTTLNELVKAWDILRDIRAIYKEGKPLPELTAADIERLIKGK